MSLGNDSKHRFGPIGQNPFAFLCSLVATYLLGILLLHPGIPIGPGTSLSLCRDGQSVCPACIGRPDISETVI